MLILKKKYINEILSDSLKLYGFKRKGSAFFRIHGDGILQVIKFEYERVFEDYDLSWGLFSLYGELLKQWFTSTGCIPRYSAVNFVNKRDPIIDIEIDGMVYSDVISPEQQIDILIEKGIPWLNSIQIQEDLVEGIKRFDKRWNDALKIAPYLASGQTNNAARVVLEILKQHISCVPKNHPATNIHWSDYVWDEKMIREYERCFPGKDEEFLSLYRMMNRNDEEEIRAYLMKNYEQNMQYAAFCKKK